MIIETVRKMLLLSTLIFIGVSCGPSSDSGKNDATDVSPEERKLVDDQLGKIDLLPQNLDECCRTLTKLKDVDGLTETPAGKAYARTKVENLGMRVIKKLSELLKDDLSKWTTTEIMGKYYVAEIDAQYGSGWEILSSSRGGFEYKDNFDGVAAEVEHTLSLKNSGGLFDAAKYMTIKVKFIVKGKLNCWGSSGKYVDREVRVELLD